jgi:hypothetical protein
MRNARGRFETVLGRIKTVAGRFPAGLSRITERRRLSFHDDRRASRVRNQFTEDQEKTTMTSIDKSDPGATTSLDLPK